MNAIIVDDTQAAIDNLVDKLQKYPDVSVVATAGTGEEGLDMIDTSPTCSFSMLSFPT